MREERLRECVRADVHRATHWEKELAKRVGIILLSPGFHAVLLYRVSHWLYRHNLHPLAALITYLNGVITGAQISPRATIGKGLIISHPHGIAIGSTTVIGEHCTLIHNNLIGQGYLTEDRPTIGDHFFAATGAKLLGNIRIGNHVTIGPNAVVIRSLPDGVTVAAAPTRVVLRQRAETHAAVGTADARAAVASTEVIAQRVKSLLAGIVGLGDNGDGIGTDTVLLGGGIGLGSIDVLNLINAIEEQFDITLDESEVETSQWTTVGSLVAFIEGRIRHE